MPNGRAVILDCETTGLDEPQVIQLAHSRPFLWGEEITSADYTVKRFCPTKPICTGAKAAHHIIEADLVESPEWSGSYRLDADYMIGHGIDFDWKALGEQPQVKRICTLALSRVLYDDADSHSLSALMYRLYEDHEARQMARHAHDAAADVQMNWLLLKELISDAQKAGNTLASFGDLWRLSEDARIPRRVTFGKFGPKDGKPGALYSEVDAGYLEWMLKQDFGVYEALAAKRELERRRWGR